MTWIGGTLTMKAGGVRATIKASIVADIIGDLQKFSALNVVSIKELQSLLGKLNHAAGFSLS